MARGYKIIEVAHCIPMKIMEGVHGKHICMSAWYYVISCFTCFGKVTKLVLTILLDVSRTFSSKGEGST